MTPTRARHRKYDSADEAFQAIQGIYNTNIKYLRDQFESFSEGKIPKAPIVAYYPEIRLSSTGTPKRVDKRLSYGYVPSPGTYATTLTRPDIFDHYYQEQLRLLIENHDAKIEVGLSDTPIPIHFALGENFYLERDLNEEQISSLPRLFTQPDLAAMDDTIANSYYMPKEGAPLPLSLFTAPRVDLSIMRLKHYTGTNAAHFQNYVIFTNYQFYIDEFIRIGEAIMSPTDDPNLRKERSAYTAFVEPGNIVLPNCNIPDNKEVAGGERPYRMPQMPAYHLKRPDGSGITMVNIGVGPSNAKTITDHISVLRPHAWLMLGHCAGLRNSQQLGDYVLAHAYLRNDQVLDDDLHPTIPIPALAEIQQALEQAVAQVTDHEGYDLKKIMRTGTVATIDDRNWELRSSVRQNRRLSQSRAIALDMESATIAANGFRFRVPYGTLLCVSDKPLHGQLKLPGMADSFYRTRVEQHLQIGLLAMALLRDIGPERLHSRKLRSFNEVAFQ